MNMHRRTAHWLLGAMSIVNPLMKECVFLVKRVNHVFKVMEFFGVTSFYNCSSDFIAHLLHFEIALSQIRIEKKYIYQYMTSVLSS